VRFTGIQTVWQKRNPILKVFISKSKPRLFPENAYLVPSNNASKRHENLKIKFSAIWEKFSTHLNLVVTNFHEQILSNKNIVEISNLSLNVRFSYCKATRRNSESKL